MVMFASSLVRQIHSGSFPCLIHRGTKFHVSFNLRQLASICQVRARPYGVHRLYVRLTVKNFRLALESESTLLDAIKIKTNSHTLWNHTLKCWHTGRLQVSSATQRRQFSMFSLSIPPLWHQAVTRWEWYHVQGSCCWADAPSAHLLAVCSPEEGLPLTLCTHLHDLWAICRVWCSCRLRQDVPGWHSAQLCVGTAWVCQGPL